jgi:hypothetical protein
LALALLGSLSLGLLLLGACALPPNTTVGDWSRSASIGTDRPSFAAPPHARPIRAMQLALARYFTAMGVLWDGAELPSQEAEFAPLAPAAAVFAPMAGEAIRTLATTLHTAHQERPLQSLPRDNSGPRPLPEDWRLTNVIASSDAAVQLLLASLARAVLAEPVLETPSLALPATDPALRQLQREEAERQAAASAARLAARQDYARMLSEIGLLHAALKGRGRLVTQREMERRVFLADDRLRRTIAALPREAPMDQPPR